MKCDKCGTEMVYFIKGLSCGYKCPKCNWNLVTTYIPPIHLDKIQYSIKLFPTENPSIDMIRVTARLFHCNDPASKKYLQFGTGSLTDKAEIIQSIARALSKAGISYSISPDFPYEI